MFKCKLSHKGKCMHGSFQNYPCYGYKDDCNYYISDYTPTTALGTIKMNNNPDNWEKYTNINIHKTTKEHLINSGVNPTDIDKIDIYKKAIEKYGIKSQIIKTIEELSELQKELCKALAHNGNDQNIREEIADVEIMIEQMRIIFSISYEKIQIAKTVKIERLRRRLEDV